MRGGVLSDIAKYLASWLIFIISTVIAIIGPVAASELCCRDYGEFATFLLVSALLAIFIPPYIVASAFSMRWIDQYERRIVKTLWKW